MSYPQLALSSAETIEGNDFFRLHTPLVSSGDVYELDTSASSFAIGPDSDISQVRLTHFDPTQPNRSESFMVSVDAPFVGRVDAFASHRFPVSNNQARLLVSIEEIINTAWVPQFTEIGYISIVQPTLDLICYLSPPLEMPKRRPDKLYRGRMGFDATNRSLLIVPLYGRRYASINAGSFFGGASVSQVGLLGANLITDAYAGGTHRDMNNQFVALTNITDSLLGDGASVNLEYRASSHGYFDYLIVNFFAGVDNTINPSTTDALYYIVRVSDKEN